MQMPSSPSPSSPSPSSSSYASKSLSLPLSHLEPFSPSSIALARRPKECTLCVSRECGTSKVTRLVMVLVVLWLCCCCLSVCPSLLSSLPLSPRWTDVHTSPIKKRQMERQRDRDREIDRRQKKKRIDRCLYLSSPTSSSSPFFSSLLSTSLLPPHFPPLLPPLPPHSLTHSHKRCSMRSWSQALVSGHSHSSHPLPERSEYNQLRNLSTLVSIP